MRYLSRCISFLTLTAAIAAPTTILARPIPQDAVYVRVYDRDHHDYHDWNDHEDHAYRRYLVERHRTYRVYHPQHYSVQRHYWNWRHSHPDHD